MRVVFVPRSVEIKPLFSDLGDGDKMERAELSWKAGQSVGSRQSV